MQARITQTFLSQSWMLRRLLLLHGIQGVFVMARNLEFKTIKLTIFVCDSSKSNSSHYTTWVTTFRDLNIKSLKFGLKIVRFKKKKAQVIKLSTT